MFESEITEIKDSMLNHYLNHFDECDDNYLVKNEGYIAYNDEYECIEAAVNCIEEIIWD